MDAKMKRVYIAGPYSGPDVLTVLQNIGRGERIAANVFLLDMAPFCPWHDKSFAIECPDTTLTVDQFYQYSLAWLEVSDAVFLVPGWESSKGTLAEIARAKELGIPVFENLGELLEWRDK
jgi:hypothetical protein